MRTGDIIFGCGVSLITPLFVLTAAHCLNRELNQVRLGEHSLKNVTDCDFDGNCLDSVQDIDISKYIKHEGYNSLRKVNDIGLVKLAHAVDLTKNNVRTICLPLKYENQLDNQQPQVLRKMTITGWGKTADGSQSDILQKAYIPFVNHSECQEYFKDTEIKIQQTFLCAGGSKFKVDSVRYFYIFSFRND